MSKTEFIDKAGKPIYTGDIVQYRLSLNAKRGGGPWTMQVHKTKKGIKLVDPETKSGNLFLRINIVEYISIIYTSQREA